MVWEEEAATPFLPYVALNEKKGKRMVILVPMVISTVLIRLYYRRLPAHQESGDMDRWISTLLMLAASILDLIPPVGVRREACA